MTVLTVKEVAESLKLTTKTVYKLISSGELKSVHVGGSLRIRQEDLDSLLEVKSNKNGKPPKS